MPSLKNFNYPENIYIEDYVSIGKENYLLATPKSKIIIKRGSILENRCRIYTVNHNYDSKDLKDIPFDYVQVVADVVAEEGVWIGDGVIILPGIKIGWGAVIGDGSVVSKSIPEYAVAAGNPAKVIKYRNASHFNMLMEADCYNKKFSCGKEWRREDEGSL